MISPGRGSNGGSDASTLENLQRVAEAALESPDLETQLVRLLERINQTLEASTATILLVDGAGEKLHPMAAAGLENEAEQTYPIPVGEGFAGQVAADRRPASIEDTSQSQGDLVSQVLKENGIRSLFAVPLTVEDQLVGVLQVGAVEPRKFSSADRQVLETGAVLAAIAIKYSQLAAADRDAREDAEASVERIEHLQRVTEAGLAYLELDDLLKELLDRITEILHVDTAAILLVEDDGQTLAARAAKGLEEEVERGFRLPIATGFAGRIAASRQSVVIEDLDHSPIEVVNPLMREKGVRSLLGVPLIVERALVGVLHVGTLTPRSFTTEDAELLQLVADRSALAIEHNRLYAQRRVAQILQRSVLPDELPRLPGVGLAARYLPAAVASAVGGDWYDVIPLEDGRVGLAIGDVVGSGLEAAALMGQLRNALRAYALEGASPEEVAAKLTRFMDAQPGDPMATFAYACFNPETSVVELVSAAHPPPLAVSPDGETQFVEQVPGPPLGAGGAPAYRGSDTTLEPGSTLLMYTDGLIEQRGHRLVDGQAALASAAAAAPFDPELLCDHVLESLEAGSAGPDDVAILAVQSVPATEGTMHLTVAARPQELAAIRRLLRRWLTSSNADQVDVSAITLACTEACSNAIEHAYGPRDASFELDATRLDDAVEVAVRDFGRWRPPRGQDRGRGIVIMRAFMDDVEVLTDDSGTIVRMKKKLSNNR